jgi:hypothetical protein
MKNYTSDPYWNLSIAIIKQAVDDCIVKRKLLKRGKEWARRVESDPEYYLFENDADTFPSFLGICAHFGISPQYLRSTITGHLEERSVEIGLSSVELLRRKMKRQRRVKRKDLSLWAWGKLRMDKIGLNALIDILKEAKEIKEELSYLETGRLIKYYEWTG